MVRGDCHLRSSFRHPSHGGRWRLRHAFSNVTQTILPSDGWVLDSSTNRDPFFSNYRIEENARPLRVRMIRNDDQAHFDTNTILMSQGTDTF